VPCVATNPFTAHQGQPRGFATALGGEHRPKHHSHQWFTAEPGRMPHVKLQAQLHQVERANDTGCPSSMLPEVTFDYRLYPMLFVCVPCSNDGPTVCCDTPLRRESLKTTEVPCYMALRKWFQDTNNRFGGCPPPPVIHDTQKD